MTIIDERPTGNRFENVAHRFGNLDVLLFAFVDFLFRHHVELEERDRLKRTRVIISMVIRNEYLVVEIGAVDVLLFA